MHSSSLANFSMNEATSPALILGLHDCADDTEARSSLRGDSFLGNSVTLAFLPYSRLTKECTVSAGWPN